MLLEFIVKNQELTRFDKHTIVEGSQHYIEVQFYMDEDRKDLSSLALFRIANVENSISVAVDENGLCKVPIEAFTHGRVYVSLLSFSDLIKITTKEVELFVLKSNRQVPTDPKDPVPMFFDELLKSAVINGNKLVFTKKNGSTLELVLPTSGGGYSYDDTIIQGKINDLTTKVEKFEGDYSSLQESYNVLQGKYDTLKESYDNLQGQVGQIDLSDYILKSTMGTPNGVATLGADSILSVSQRFEVTTPEVPSEPEEPEVIQSRMATPLEYYELTQVLDKDLTKDVTYQDDRYVFGSTKDLGVTFTHGVYKGIVLGQWDCIDLHINKINRKTKQVVYTEELLKELISNGTPHYVGNGVIVYCNVDFEITNYEVE